MGWMFPEILTVAITAGVLFLLLVWFKRKRAALIKALGKDLILVNETLVFGPVTGLYQGANQPFGFTGNCVATLTSRRFIYATITGRREELPLSDIATVSENEWFAGKFLDGRLHLILELKDGRKVGFLLRNHSQMLGALRGLLTSSVS
jgi:hypothetical protein